MKDYYRILLLQPGASEADIKRSYRTLAKRYHPDINPSEDARIRFIEVNEAYEFLLHPDRRVKAQPKSTVSQEEKRRREAAYRQWPHEQKQARRRAEVHANTKFDNFANSPIFKTAMLLNKVYDYIFLAVGCLIIFSPLFNYLSLPQEDKVKYEFSWVKILFPVIIGSLFTLGIYLFVFKKKHEKYQ